MSNSGNLGKEVYFFLNWLKRKGHPQLSGMALACTCKTLDLIPGTGKQNKTKKPPPTKNPDQRRNKYEFYRAGEMAQWVRALSPKHDDLALEAQNPCKDPGVIVFAYNPSISKKSFSS